MIYRIKDWSANFENNRSKILKKTDWVPIPNKMDGEGYAELVDHPNGAQHYAAWLAIVLIASRCEERGLLWRDGKALTPRSLAMISRLPAAIFADAIPRLLSSEIGWLEDVSIDQLKYREGAGFTNEGAGFSPNPAPPCQISDKSSNAYKENARAEGKGIEEKGIEVSTYPNISSSGDDGLFALVPSKPVSVDKSEKIRKWFDEQFWPMYPRKVARKAALKSAIKSLPGVQPSLVLTGLSKQLPGFAALIAAGEPDRIPHASTWLNGRRWEDEVSAVSVIRPNGHHIDRNQRRRDETLKIAEFLRAK